MVDWYPMMGPLESTSSNYLDFLLFYLILLYIQSMFYTLQKDMWCGNIHISGPHDQILMTQEQIESYEFVDKPSMHIWSVIPMAKYSNYW
jgi:hypothetical protein